MRVSIWTKFTLVGALIYCMALAPLTVKAGVSDDPNRPLTKPEQQTLDAMKKLIPNAKRCLIFFVSGPNLFTWSWTQDRGKDGRRKVTSTSYAWHPKIRAELEALVKQNRELHLQKTDKPFTEPNLYKGDSMGDAKSLDQQLAPFEKNAIDATADCDGVPVALAW